MKRGYFYLFCSLFLVIVFSACSFFEKEEVVVPIEEPLPKCLTHVVQMGDTLANIAKWYTGDADNWQKIAEANPDISERSMEVGVEICIPFEIVTNSEPLVRKISNNTQTRINDPVKKEVTNNTPQKQIGFDELKAEVKQETIDAETATVRESLGFGQNIPPVEEQFNNREDAEVIEDIYEETNLNEEDSFADIEEDEEDELSKARSELLREMLQDE